MRILILVAMPALLLSCVSPPVRTSYHLSSGDGGYTDLEKDTLVKVSGFAGNASTDVRDAAALAQFRAIELCDESNQLAQVISVTNQTTSQEVIMSSTADFTTKVWNETNTYPKFLVSYICSDKIVSLTATTKNLKFEDMKILVKDLLGAVQIEKVESNSPNFSILENGDIITKLNGKRVKDNGELAVQLNLLRNNQNVKLNIFREGKPLEITAHLVDVTESLKKSHTADIASLCKVGEISMRPICAKYGYEDKHNKPLIDRLLSSGK